MERVEGQAIARFGLPPGADDLDEIRRLLDHEIELETAEADDSDTLIMKEYCVLLFSARRVEDSLRVWRAKSASFDAGCSIDVQLMCGAGFEATCRFLRSSPDDDAPRALAYLLACEAAGDFAGHDAPDGRLATALDDYRRYYQAGE